MLCSVLTTVDCIGLLNLLNVTSSMQTQWPASIMTISAEFPFLFNHFLQGFLTLTGQHDVVIRQQNTTL